jgi:hypothetical protein
VYAPVAAGGVAVFGRDPESSREIWSRAHGYPGHPAYREYHRDIGLDGDADVVVVRRSDPLGAGGLFTNGVNVGMLIDVRIDSAFAHSLRGTAVAPKNAPAAENEGATGYDA